MSSRRGPISRFVLSIIAVLLAAGPAVPAELKLIVVGDSLSEEYAFQTAFSAPASDPGVSNTPNWVRTIANHRTTAPDGDTVSFGGYAPVWGDYPDPRGGGYETNWGIPNFTSFHWVVALGSSGGPFKTTIRDGIVGQFEDTAALVLMVGMADLIADYAEIHEGTEPAGWFSTVVGQVMAMHDYLAAQENAPPIVVCTIPDVGATPAMRSAFPDPVKRASARARIQAMNDDLKTLATDAGAPVADIHARLLEMADASPFLLNLIPFIYGADPENPSDHLFCKDGRHPGMVASGLIAAEVIRAVNELGNSITPLGNREIMTSSPDIIVDQPFFDWIELQNVSELGLHDNPDGDPYDNMAEFALGSDPAIPDGGLAIVWVGPSADHFSIVWTLNPAAEGYLVVEPEQSSDLDSWSPADPDYVVFVGLQSWRASIPPEDPARFLRVKFDFAP